MKAFCKTHGVHFPADFKQTIKEDCSFWRDRGLDDLTAEYKRMLWEWMFSFPGDQIFGATGYEIAFAIRGQKKRAKYLWHKLIKGYNKMTERQRQEAQKKYFLRRHRG